MQASSRCSVSVKLSTTCSQIKIVLAYSHGISFWLLMFQITFIKNKPENTPIQTKHAFVLVHQSACKCKLSSRKLNSFICTNFLSFRFEQQGPSLCHVLIYLSTMFLKPTGFQAPYIYSSNLSPAYSFLLNLFHYCKFSIFLSVWFF